MLSAPKVYNKVMPFTNIYIESHILRTRVALTRAEQEQGLKQQKSLSDSDGLLIVLPEPIITAVWMKDTALPLSAAFIDKNLTIVEIQKLTPFSETYSVTKQPIQIILEVNQNWFEKRDIQVGQTVKIENIKDFIAAVQPPQIGFKIN